MGNSSQGVLMEILKALNLLKAAYPYFTKERTPEQVEETFAVYVRTLADADPDLLKAAVLQTIAESRFFPTVAELRERMIAVKQSAVQIPDHTQAWSELMSEVRRVGFQSWDDTHFSTPLVREIAKIYWRDACLTDLDNLPTVRAQFRDSYNARVKRQIDQDRLLPQTRELIKNLSDRLDAGKRLLSGGGNGNDHD